MLYESNIHYIIQLLPKLNYQNL